MDILAYPFFRNALVGIIIISLTAAVIGTYIVTRRIVFIAGGITHTSFGGLGLGYWLGLPPFPMAAAVAVAGSLGVEYLRKRNARQDSAIAAIWALGMALGILFIFLTPGYVPELNTFLFGNVLTITPSDNLLFAAFTALLIAVYLLFYRRIIAVSFDQDFARTRRLPVSFINNMMIVLTACAIVLTIRMIGIMLLISLVSLPQMVAERLIPHLSRGSSRSLQSRGSSRSLSSRSHSSRFWGSYGGLMAMSAIISTVAGVGGLLIAYWLSVPASAAIILLLALLYLLTLPFN